jgi:hypothetical protein
MLQVLPLLASASLAYALALKGYSNPGLTPRPLPPAISAPPSLEFHAFLVTPSGDEHPPLGTVYYFNQYIDHNDPKRGTFKQRYWVSWGFYEPGAWQRRVCHTYLISRVLP